MAKQCQSCSMPLKDNNRGTENDGSLSMTYCSLCYENGKFKDPNLTVTQMQDKVVSVLREKHWPRFMAKFAAKQVPRLERWRGA